jgi:UPF0716 protein FxsA
MIPRLGCLFIVVPLLELALLIQVGRWIGVVPTVALVAATGLLGLYLVRREGVRTLARIQLDLAQGRLPHRALLDGACILVGGAFMMTPGVVTDALALALLFAPTRRAIQRWLTARMERALRAGTLNVHVYGRTSTHQDPRGGEVGRPGLGEAGSGREGDNGDDGPPGRGPRPGESIQD